MANRWAWLFWLIVVAVPLLFPSKLLLINEIAILALFALSLDLLLGYAGIVSLGHAAFFGVGAYAAGLLAKHGMTEPVSGLLLASGAAAIVGFLSSFLVLRGSDLTRLMVTMGVALMLLEVANRFDTITGGADGLQGVTMGPILGLFRFDLFGRTACAYSLATLLLLFLIARRIVQSPFGLSLRAVKGNRLRATAVGVPADARLIAIYTIAAAYAGAAGALLAQTTQFVSLDVLDFHRSADVLLVLVLGGSGYLYGGLIGAAIFKLMQDALAAWTPQYWQFWIGLVLVLIVLVGRERLAAAGRTVWARLTRRQASERPS
ncbi:MAG TPA: branched-chain amino acid ABC transporter permease [Vineibacter sp.]|nr:branched-chain amino acid ABC transporter permease [Vineibacter sp.]